MQRPRIMLAGEKSGTGKWTVTLGIMAALRARELEVQPLKAGPDHLDPMHHNAVGDRISGNLDAWMFQDCVPVSFQRVSAGADVSVIEWVMGLYDGMDGRSEERISAHLTKRISCPVILVLDATSRSGSIGAVVKGFATFDPAVDVRGVIFNKISGPRHMKIAEDAVRSLGLISLGGIHKDEGVGLESRYLVPVPAGERNNRQKYERLREITEENLDLDIMLRLAAEASGWQEVDGPPPNRVGDSRLGAAKDDAFNFYYRDNLDILKAMGARIAWFSSLEGDLPNADGYYLGGGYPELHLDEPEASYALMESLLRRVEEVIPAYAECGGPMYLCQKLRGHDGGGVWTGCSMHAWRWRGNCSPSATSRHDASRTASCPRRGIGPRSCISLFRDCTSRERSLRLQAVKGGGDRWGHGRAGPEERPCLTHASSSGERPRVREEVHNNVHGREGGIIGPVRWQGGDRVGDVDGGCCR